MSVTVKAYMFRGHIGAICDAEIRRFSIDEGNFSVLQSKLANFFPTLNGKAFRMFWKDEEGDYVSFSSDAELTEAFENVKNGVLRIYVCLSDEGTGTNSPKVSSDRATDSSGGGAGGNASSRPTGVHHPGVVCDSCEGPVYGPRYKCLECMDYDLCHTCEAAGKHAEHAMVRISAPGSYDPHQPFMQFGSFGHGPFGRAAAFGCGRRMRNHRGPPGAAKGDGGAKHCPFAGRMHGSWSFSQNQNHHGQAQAQAQTQSAETGEPNTQHDNPEPRTQNTMSGEDFLKNVGDQVAAMLDPLGIDVEVDIEHGGYRKRCEIPIAMPDAPRATPDAPGASPDAPKASTDAPGASPDSTRAGPDSPRATPDTPKATPDTPKANPDALGPEVKQMLANLMAFVTDRTNSEDDSMTGVDHGRQPSPTAGDVGWTVINPTVETDGPSDISATIPAPNNHTMPAEEEDPFSKFLDPRVARSLVQMKAMGFNNDGGWLSNLLTAKNGDICATLDSLKPSLQSMTNGDKMA